MSADREIQRAVLTVIRDCPPDESFVFTNVLDAKVPGDLAWYRRVERVAKQRNARFFPVWLTCDAWFEQLGWTKGWDWGDPISYQRKH